MTKLSVNLNKIAWLRNARGGFNPDILEMASICISSGADGITVHPRSDMRHIEPEDVINLKKFTIQKGVEFNIEGNPFSEAENDYPGFMNLVGDNIPNQCTLVPDKADQLTSDHGWNLTEENLKLQEIVDQLKNLGIRVSLFMDPDLDQISRAKSLGVDRVELFTGPYAHSVVEGTVENIIPTYQESLSHAISIGLEVNAGHDLNLNNLKNFLNLGTIEEVSIGHALISDALVYGLENTIKMYKSLCI